jgi:hypothetical protein
MIRTVIVIVIMMAVSVFAQPAAINTLGIDASRANIPVGEILSGGPPPQGIPALSFSGDWTGSVPAGRQASYISQEEASEWLEPQEPVIAMNIGGAARAYPLQILTWHEIANDQLAGVPIAVTFCPLCNSALAFDRRVPVTDDALTNVQDFNPEVATVPLDDDFVAAYERQTGNVPAERAIPVTFGVSGLLYNSNLLMFDSDTSTLWSQLLGEGNVGTLTNTELLRYPAQIVSFAEFQEAFPAGDVLSRDTGYSRGYGRNPYVGYDDIDSPAFLFRGETDGRLPPKERVISVVQGDTSVAYPFSELSEARVVQDQIAGTPVVVFWQEGTASALDQAVIAESTDVGGAGIFGREVDGQVLDFVWHDDAFVDEQTGSTWNLLGQAVAGELKGNQLTPVVHDNTLWFAWAAFKPETRIYTVE